ncbi:MAG: monovalent cation/H+ antiporter subunit D family protein [Alphaproteobacteria bacterium]|nr:monovalent cation/H+ antiporter subunit D family protein [Alphaproteobacteria bacterium]
MNGAAIGAWDICLPVLLPMAATVLIGLTGRWPNLREAVTLITSGVLVYLVVGLIQPVFEGARPDILLFEMMPGLSIRFTVEPLGALFAGVASFLWIITSIYSIGYMRGHHEKNQTRFYICFAIAIGSAMGVALAGNMLTLFVFYEVLTFSTYPLVTHAGTDEARLGGRTYLGVLVFTSICLQLPAVIWTWYLAGTLDFTPGGILEGTASPELLGALFVLYVFGIGKAAVMPFHRWLPAAMVAPTPVSALLHAVAVVKAGVFTVLKITYFIFGLELASTLATGEFLLYAAAATILIASLVALRQDNLKRRLAYSTVSQLSYIVLAAMLANELAMVGGGMHIAMHAFGKITLFFCAGAILVAAHKTEVSQLNGIGRRMPWTMGAFAVGSISMIGVPPTAGFVSKWYILIGAFESQQFIAVLVIVASTLLNAAYLLPIVYVAFFKKPDDEPQPNSHRGSIGAAARAPHGEAPLSVVLALVATAAGTIILFLFPGSVLTLAQQIVASGG